MGAVSPSLAVGAERTGAPDADPPRGPGDPASAPPSLVLAGGHPPPLGGVTVHVARLAARAAADGWRVTVLNQVAPSPGVRFPSPGVRVVDLPRSPLPAAARMLGQAARARPDALHLHVSWLYRAAWIGAPLLGIGPRGGRLLTLHSGSFAARWREGGATFRAAVRVLCRAADRVIAVNGEIADLLRGEGIVPAERVVELPGFLFPPRPAGNGILGPAFDLARPPGGRVALVAGGFLPLYGFLEAVEALRPGGADRWGLVVAHYGPIDPDCEREVRLRSAGLRCVFLRDLSPDTFAEALTRCDAFLRPTERDGDSVAVREALHFGRQVIASDVVARPPGVAIYRKGDAGSLAAALQAAARDPRFGRGDPGPDAYATLASLYRGALAARRGEARARA